MVGKAQVGDYYVGPEPKSKPAVTQTVPIYVKQTHYTWFLNHQQNMRTALVGIAGLTSNPQLLDENWKNQMAVYLAIIRAGYQEAQTQTPPNSMSHIHTKYVEALSHYDSAAVIISLGIDNLDANSFEQATNEISIGNSLMLEANRLLAEFSS